MSDIDNNTATKEIAADSASAALEFAAAFDGGEAASEQAAAAVAADDTTGAPAAADGGADEWDFTDPTELAAEQAQAAMAPADDKDDKNTDPNDDIEKSRAQLQQRLRSAKGRLAKDPGSEKLAAQVAQLTRAIESLADPASLPAASAAAPASAAPAAAQVVPEGWTAEEWQSFAQDYPDDAADILAAQGPAEDTAQAAQAQVDAAHQALESRKQFNAPIVAAHPDYYEIVSAANWPQFEQFIASIDDDVKRAGAMRIVESGSAAEIIALVSQYKAYRNPPPPPQGQAVRTRGTQPKPTAGNAEKDSFAAGWNS